MATIVHALRSQRVAILLRDHLRRAEAPHVVLDGVAAGIVQEPRPFVVVFVAPVPEQVEVHDVVLAYERAHLPQRQVLVRGRGAQVTPVRAAELANALRVVLGLVGAGGIGAPLIFAMSSYRWNEVGAILLGLIILVLIIEAISAKIRVRLARG